MVLPVLRIVFFDVISQAGGERVLYNALNVEADGLGALPKQRARLAELCRMRQHKEMDSHQDIGLLAAEEERHRQHYVEVVLDTEAGLGQVVQILELVLDDVVELELKGLVVARQLERGLSYGLVVFHLDEAQTCLSR